jgi:hypothetical protein
MWTRASGFCETLGVTKSDDGLTLSSPFTFDSKHSPICRGSGEWDMLLCASVILDIDSTDNIWPICRPVGKPCLMCVGQRSGSGETASRTA